MNENVSALLQHANNIHKWEKQIESLKTFVDEVEKKNGDSRPIKARIKVLFQNIIYTQGEIEKLNRIGVR